MTVIGAVMTGAVWGIGSETEMTTLVGAASLPDAEAAGAAGAGAGFWFMTTCCGCGTVGSGGIILCCGPPDIRGWGGTGLLGSDTMGLNTLVPGYMVP